MKEHVWVRLSAVAKALGRSSSTIATDTDLHTRNNRSNAPDFDWVRALIVGSNTSTITLQIDDDEVDDHDYREDIHTTNNTDCPPSFQWNGKLVELPIATTLVLPTNEWTDMISSDQVPTPPDDLMTLTHLHEPAVVYCLEKRFQIKAIYTNTGPILIALNPNQDLPDLYSDECMANYWAHGEGIIHDSDEFSHGGSNSKKLPPHVYQTAHAAFRSMMNALHLQEEQFKSTTTTTESSITCTKNQSILVSGESGSGKTVSTKHIMRYLASLSQHKAKHDASRKRAPSPGRGGTSESNEPPSRKESFSTSAAATTTTSSSSSKRPVGMLRRGMSARSVSWKAGALIEEKILQSNPILEAFGNARTIRNDNSSRFGKFIELQFKHTGSLIGAALETYLLEKVRLVHISHGERTFHVFYEMLAAATPQERNMFYIGNYTARDFKMTSASDCYDRRDGANDARLFDKLVLAMRTLGFDTDAQTEIFSVTVAFLHASNLTFLAITDDSSKVDDANPHLHPVLALLGIDKDAFQLAICEFTIEAGNKSYTRHVNKELAEKGLEALIKATYGAMFSYIVQTINRKVDYREQEHKVHGQATAAFIGVLDIFGFESFPSNSFEQLCINYCNEALQQQFNLFVFKKEQEEYRHEGITWEFIEFPDNQDVIDLIDQKRTGIISILTDQCRAPRGTDGSFRDAMYNECGNHVRFEASALQRGNKQFSVLHYAGPVTYDTEGFVEKNKDEIPRGASKLLQSSSKAFVQLLGKIIDAPAAGSSPPGSLRASARTKRPTVGSQFKRQLDKLRGRIEFTIPHYIRCLKPNESMQPDEFDKGMVAEQLRNAGVLEAIRVSRVGYSQRFERQLFRNRYRVISVADSAESVEALCEALAKMIWTEENPDKPLPEDLLNGVGLQIGANKVFLRQPAYDFIERIRSQQLELCTIIIQTTARSYIARNRYSQLHSRILLLQALARGFLARKQWEEHHKSAVAIQCMFRNNIARSELVARREARVREVEEQRREEAMIAVERQAALEREQAREDAATAKKKALQSELERRATLESELERVKTELEASRAEAAQAKARAATLQAENKRLKQQLKPRLHVSNGRPSSHYAAHPDLRTISEDMTGLVGVSKQNMRDLETLAKALSKLK